MAEEEKIGLQEKVADKFIEFLFLLLILVAAAGATTYVLGGTIVDVLAFLF